MYGSWDGDVPSSLNAKHFLWRTAEVCWLAGLGRGLAKTVLVVSAFYFGWDQPLGMG